MSRGNSASPAMQDAAANTTVAVAATLRTIAARFVPCQDLLLGSASLDKA